MSKTKTKTTNQYNGKTGGKSKTRDPRGRKDQTNDKVYRKLDCESPEAANDVSWYAKTPQLLADAASLAYSSALGSKFNLRNTDSDISNVNEFTDGYTPEPGLSDITSVPGVMAIDVALIPGLAVDKSSAINIASDNLYSFIRHANSGSANYEAPDLMIKLLAVDSAYSFWSWLVRAYGVARTYSVTNRYFPLAILEAMGFNATSFINNLADIRAAINMLAVKLSSIAVPTNMPIFMRHLWMFQNLYWDKPTEKAQVYLFRPACFYKYEAYSDERGGKLKPISRPVIVNGASIVSFTEELINGILYDEDIGIMSGDILKAFGSSIYRLNPISEDYTVVPSYNEEVLSQIHNMSWYDYGSIVDDDNWSVYQEDGVLKFNPTFVWNTQFGFEPMINMFKDNVTAADTMVATRLMPVVSNKGGVVSGHASFDAVGTEVVTDVHIGYLDNGGYQEKRIIKFMDYFYINEHLIMTLIQNPDLAEQFTPVFMNATNVSLGLEILQSDILASSFDWHPIMQLRAILAASNASGQFEFKYSTPQTIGDVQVYTIPGRDALTRMHEVAVLSEFDVPYALGSN